MRATGFGTGLARGLLYADPGRATVRESYWDRQTTGQTASAGSPNSAGLTTAELQAPTAATGIYAFWDDYDLDSDGRIDADDDAWNFGQANQYPALKYRGLATAIQFNVQPDTAPTFGSTSVSDKVYGVGETIEPLAIPLPTGGNGAYDYTVTDLPTGLVFDEDGTGDCRAARTVCGIPTVAGTSTLVTVAVQDADANMASSDQATLTFTIRIGGTAAITASGPATLNQGNLRGANLSVTLTGATYAAGANASHFTVAGVPGLTVYSVWFNAGRTVATLRLHYDGSDFDAAAALAVTIAAAATTDALALTTAARTVAPVRWVNVSKKSIALTEGLGAGFYTVVLESPPTGDVTLTVTSDNAAVTLSGGATSTTLTFTTQNWNTAKIVGVSPANDADAVDEVALVANVASGGGYAHSAAASRTVRVTVDDDEQTGTDYDADNDGLIEISGHAQLNAMRWDLDGNGVSLNSGYASAFPSAATGMGCPDGGDSNQVPDNCLGYELTADIDLDTAGDGVATSTDAYWNAGQGWDPIGDAEKKSETPYTATFRGNGHVISNLWINASGGYSGNYGWGLFASLRGARIESLGLDGASIATNFNVGAEERGALVGRMLNGSTVVGVYAQGSMSTHFVGSNGGLAGVCNGAQIVASYADVNVYGHDGTGGLVGVSQNNKPQCTILASYARGPVRGVPGYGNNNPRGLIFGASGRQANVRDSYWDRQTTGQTASTGSPNSAGLTTAELQAPTAATGIYGFWDDYDLDGDGRIDADDDAWHFGQANQYPALKYRGLATTAQFQAQLSGQTDTAPTFGDATVPDKTYELGETIEPFAIPLTTGGNGTYDYTVTGLPTGIVFDEDGSGACAAARTVCGTANLAGTHTVRVTVQDADTNTASSDQASLTFKIAVNGDVLASPARLSLTEGGGGAYTVVLSHAPTASVTVTIASDNPAVTLNAGSLTFTTQNWDTAQPVTATGASDADAVDELALISNTASGGGYDDISATVRVTVDDDEPKAGADHDVDNDGLIDIDSVAKLNGLRWDLDGDGVASSGNETNYANAFGGVAAGMGCPDSGDADQLPDACSGYELTADLDFDADDAPASWTPIAGYATLLDGHGHSIANLTVTATSSHSGLFSTTAASSTIRALGLVDAWVSSNSPYVGALAGTISGRVEAVYATGSVSGSTTVGGLVGQAATTAAIVASYSTVAVHCTSSAAGAARRG